MDLEDTASVEVSLNPSAATTRDGVNTDAGGRAIVHDDDKVNDFALSTKPLEGGNAHQSLTARSLRKNKLLGHERGVSSQQLWVNELDSDQTTSPSCPSIVETSSASSKGWSEEESGTDKSTVSTGSLTIFFDNHAHLLPIALQQVSSSRTVKTSGSKKPSFTASTRDPTGVDKDDAKSAKSSDDSSFFSLKLLSFQETLRSGRGREGSALDVFGYESDEEELDTILGTSTKTKSPKKSKTLSAWNANIVTALASKKDSTGLCKSSLPPTSEEPDELQDLDLKELPTVQSTSSEESYSSCKVDQMDYSIASKSTQEEGSDVVYELQSHRDPLQKYRLRRKRRFFRMALWAILCTLASIMVTAAVLTILHYSTEESEITQAVDTWDVTLTETPSQQPSQIIALSPSSNTATTAAPVVPDIPPSAPIEETILPTSLPSRQLTETPTITFATSRPSKQPTEVPSEAPSQTTPIPTQRPTPLATENPTLPPTKPPSQRPTMIQVTATPTERPTENPTRPPTQPPTQRPTGKPSSLPTKKPTQRPTGKPSSPPTKKPTLSPTDVETLVSTFYVVGDLPYNNKERDRLIYHVNNLPSDAEFLIHVGDIRDAETKENCQRSEFADVANILKQSPVPVFIVPGDNEYNDCPNLDESWGDWIAEFGDFQDHWDSQLRVTRDPTHEENFFFVHKRVLYIGLNVVGGWRHDYDEWEKRLDLEWRWTRDLIETYVRPVPSDASSIVIIAHADPRPSAHAPFFEPLKSYIRNELKNEVPMIYVNGDQHYWQFDTNFYGEPSFHRLMVEGGSKEPALKMTMTIPNNPYQGALEINDVYSYDRRL